jgi:hypothetical protein
VVSLMLRATRNEAAKKSSPAAIAIHTVRMPRI